MEALERGAYDRYTRDCHNVDVLETLERQRLSPAERVRFLERKLAAVPRLVQGHRQLTQLRDLVRRQGRINRPLRPDQIEAARRGILTAFPEIAEFPFPPGYAVGSEADERTRVQCQLSRARWELMSLSRHGTIPGRRLP
jgi:hypothetical protein